MTTGRQRLAAVLLITGSVLTVAARSYAWHSVQNGFTAVPRSLDVCLIGVAVAVALIAGGLAVTAHPQLEPVAGFAAVVLASMLVAALTGIGDHTDTPDTGAWMAGGAVLVLGAAAIALRLRGALQAVAIVAVGAIALAAVVLPPDWPSPQIEVIR
jgi:predicted membrane channel-forming protein YqfA (hemolysin III family)